MGYRNERIAAIVGVRQARASNPSNDRLRSRHRGRENRRHQQYGTSPCSRSVGILLCGSSRFGAALTIWVLAFSSASPLPEGFVVAGLTVVLCAFWFTIAAALFVIPAVLVGYPIAIIIIHRGRSLPLTIVSGALLGPTIGSLATLSSLYCFVGPGPTSWINSAKFLAPAALAGGAAMAWVVARREMPTLIERAHSVSRKTTLDKL